MIMPVEHSEKTNVKEESSDIKPDKETTNTTDPQEHMKGPLSSLMKSTEESFESEDSDKKGPGPKED
jgi:hypothetical protein